MSEPPATTLPVDTSTGTTSPASATPTHTKTPVHPSPPDQKTPTGPRAIEPDNAAQLAELGRIGNGAIQAAPVYSPDGRWLALPTATGIVLYDASSLEMQRKIPVGTSFIAFSPDGNLLAAGGSEAVTIWDPTSGQQLGELSDQPGVYYWDLDFSPDGTRLAAVAWNNEILVWSLESETKLFSFPGNALQFSPDGEQAVVMDYTDRQAHLYNLSDGQQVNQWPVHAAGFAPGGQLWLEAGDTLQLAYPDRDLITAPFKGVQPAFATDGSLMALYDAEQIWLYDPVKGRRIRPLAGDYHALDGLAFSPDGRTVAGDVLSLHCPTCSEIDGLDRSLILWRVEDGSVISQIDHPAGRAAYSADGLTLAITFRESLQVIQAQDGSIIRQLGGFYAALPGAALSSDGDQLAAVYATDPYTLRLWDLSTGDAIRVLYGRENASAETSLAVALSPDATALGVRSEVWNLATGEHSTALELAIVEQTHCASSAMAFSPDSTTLATGCYEGQLDLWSVSKGEHLRRIGDYTGWVEDLAYAPDGSYLAAAYGEPDNLVQVYQLPEGTPVARLTGRHCLRIAFSPDGRSLALVAANPVYEQYGQPGGFVQIWEPWNSSEPVQINVDDAVSLAFSPDGQMLATGSFDGSLRLWELPAGRLLMETDAHFATITRLAFTPEGDRLVAASLDGTISIWSTPEQP